MPAREPASPAAARSGSRAGPARGRYAAVLALQRSIGNAATRRILARSPRKPYQHQWENPALLETIYPARETMLKKFVSMYREIELADLTDPVERQKVVESTRAAMQKEIDRLKALPDPTPKDSVRIKELEAALAKGASSATRAWDDAVRWEREHRTDGMAGAALMAEVRRLFGTKGVPDWLEPMVLDYAGMRYKSAHGSYYNPVRLLYFLEREKGTWASELTKETADAQAAYEKKKAEWEANPDKKARGKAPAKPGKITKSAAEKAAMDMSPEDAIKRLEALRDAGEIPDWAWHKIVRLTELRTYYAEKGWEDTAAEKPTGGPNDALWTKAIAGWTGDKAVGGFGYGITGWRREIQRRNVLVTTRMVCNELSEATQRQRGVDLEGGISKNARQYVRASLGQNGKRPVAGAYFKQPSSLADLKPGAALFWVNDSEWMTEEPDDSNKVYGIAGAVFPMPPPPEYVKEWKAWRDSDAGKAWKQADAAYKKDLKAYEDKVKKGKAAASKAKTAFDPASVGPAPVKPSDTQPEYKEGKLLPADGEESNGWTYTVKVGQPITRSKDGVTHWLRWRHQATVLKAMSESRIFTFETTDALAGSARLGVSGFAERSLASLSKPGVFVGYIPMEGEVVEPEAEADGLPEFPDTILDVFKILVEP